MYKILNITSTLLFFIKMIQFQYIFFWSNKVSKKILIAFLLICVSILFCSCKPVLNNRETKFEITDVATLTIFSYDGKGESKFGISNLGHSFLSITNNI